MNFELKTRHLTQVGLKLRIRGLFLRAKPGASALRRPGRGGCFVEFQIYPAISLPGHVAGREVCLRKSNRGISGQSKWNQFVELFPTVPLKIAPAKVFVATAARTDHPGQRSYETRPVSAAFCPYRHLLRCRQSS